MLVQIAAAIFIGLFVLRLVCLFDMILPSVEPSERAAVDKNKMWPWTAINRRSRLDFQASVLATRPQHQGNMRSYRR